MATCEHCGKPKPDVDCDGFLSFLRNKNRYDSIANTYPLLFDKIGKRGDIQPGSTLWKMRAVKIYKILLKNKNMNVRIWYQLINGVTIQPTDDLFPALFNRPTRLEQKKLVAHCSYLMMEEAIRIKYIESVTHNFVRPPDMGVTLSKDDMTLLFRMEHRDTYVLKSNPKKQYYAEKAKHIIGVLKRSDNDRYGMYTPPSEYISSNVAMKSHEIASFIRTHSDDYGVE